MVLYDVVVVGGGISGLVAAAKLSRIPALNVLLLEKSDRIGGQIYTQLKERVGNVEHGCCLFKSTKDEVVNLVQELNLDICKVNTDVAPSTIWSLNSDGDYDCMTSIKPLNLDQDVLVEKQKVVQKMAEISCNIEVKDPFKFNYENICQLDRLSLQGFLDEHCRLKMAKNLISFRVRILLGIDPELISVLTVLIWAKSLGGIDQVFGAANFQSVEYLTVKTGFSSICNKLAEKVSSIELNQNVVDMKIDANNNVVLTSETNKTFEARRVIFAANPKLFSDSLKLKKPLNIFIESAISKFSIYYKRSFWRDFNSNFNGTILNLNGDENNIPLTMIMDSSNKDIISQLATLTGFICGKRSLECSMITENELKKSLLRTLSGLFGDDWPDKEVEHFEVHHWTGEQAPKLPAVGQMEQFYSFLKEPYLDGKLFLAGSYVAINNMFELGGAIEAGRMAALDAGDSIFL